MAETFRVLVVGGSGATGKCLVRTLLQSPRVTTVTTIGRKEYDVFQSFQNVEKLNQVIAKLDNLEELLQNPDFNPKHDIAFCTIGTSRSAAGSDEAFKMVDCTYVINFARFCKEHCGVKQFHVLSSDRACKSSMFLYLRTKGKMEEGVIGVGLDYCAAYRAPLLDRGNDASFMYKAASYVVTSMKLEEAANCMVKQAFRVADHGSKDKYNIFEPSQMKAILHNDE